MKNLNILMAGLIGLALLAIPAATFGQVSVSCDSCTHVVSVYMGEGGLVASTDAEEVDWVATCGGVTTSGELMPDANGMVSTLFSDANGLACAAGGSMELGPVNDGGWFWITDAMNSAVGGLVAKDILDNEATAPVSAGGVDQTAGSGAVFLKQASTGRVGILPNILPEPPAAPAAICGPRRSSRWPYFYTVQASSNCMLGDGLTKIRLVGPGGYGSRSTLTNNMVYRPLSGSITVTADLWVNESGSYSTLTGDTTGAGIRRGWLGKTDHSSQTDHRENWLGASFSLSLDSNDPQEGDLSGAGVALTSTGGNSDPVGQATITISANSAYCPSKGTQYAATVNIFATPASGEASNSIHPAITVGEDAHGLSASALSGVAAITQLRVVCAPASSADQGQDLVPENPFPTDK